MTKFFLFLICLLPQLTSAQIQSGRVVYKVCYIADIREDTKDVENTRIRKAIIDLFTEQKETAPFVHCILNFNTSASIFKMEEGMANDNGMDINDTYKIATGHGGVFYTDVEQQEVLNQFKGINGLTLGSIKFDDLDWRITDETKRVNGYLCRKAEVEVNFNAVKRGTVTAWFTTDIPFQYGPMEFVGLPGFVLAVERNNFYFYADKITLSKKEQLITPPSKGERMSMQDYYNLLNHVVDSDS